MTLNDVMKNIAIDNTSELYVNGWFKGKATKSNLKGYKDYKVVEIKHDILAKKIKIYMGRFN